MTTTGIDLSDGWDFVHDSGAMVSITDSTYLFFGWWLNSDKDGLVEASAFTGTVGADADITAITPTALADITSGSATYSGKAAGKYAISHPINGGEAGHFTADASLTAKFGTAAGAGVTGTIDNFMASGEAKPWSVALNHGDLATGGAITSPDDTATANVDESKSTVWSIDGTAGAASGTWNAQMYDEKPGNTPPAGDGSNVPTSVTGVFQSHFGSDHTMVGAFGATKE